MVDFNYQPQLVIAGFLNHQQLHLCQVDRTNAATNVKAEAGAMTPPWIMTRWAGPFPVPVRILEEKNSTSQRRFGIDMIAWILDT